MRLRWVIIAVILVLGGAALFMQQRARMQRVEREQSEAALRGALAEMRGAIAKFHSDNGRRPHSLEELVPKYLRAVPRDPIAKTNTWRLTTEETVQPSDDFAASSAPKSESVVIDVHSTAPGYGDY